MSEMLSIYIETLHSSIAKLNKSSENLRICSSDKIGKYKNDGELAYNEAAKMIKLIEISPSNSGCESKAKEYKKDLLDARKAFNLATQEVEENYAKSCYKEDLNYSKCSKESLIDNELNMNEAYRQYDKLEVTKRKILEVEKTGTNIQRELHQHTETMVKVNSNIGSMNIEIDDSGSLIKQMLKREVKNKVLLCSVIVVVVIIFLVILFIKLSGGNSGLKQNLSNGEVNEEADGNVNYNSYENIRGNSAN
jgi:hypothetical protein